MVPLDVLQMRISSSATSSSCTCTSYPSNGGGVFEFSHDVWKGKFGEHPKWPRKKHEKRAVDPHFLRYPRVVHTT